MSYPPPPQQYYPPVPPQQPRPGRGPVLLAGIGGFVVAAVIAAVLIVTGVVGDDASGVGGSSDTVSLPKTVGGYVRFEDASKVQNDRGKTIVAQRTKTSARTAEALSKAHDGAGAAVQAYTSQDLNDSFSVWAVRAPTPTPVVAVVDPADLGLAAAPQSVRVVGNSTCFISTTTTTVAGKTPDPDSIFVGFCQRSSGDLTVSVYLNGGGDLSHEPEKIAGLVDDVWNGLS